MVNVSPKERTEYMGMRVTPEEKAKVKAQASALGLSITSYLIGLALGTIAGQNMQKPRAKDKE